MLLTEKEVLVDFRREVNASNRFMDASGARCEVLFSCSTFAHLNRGLIAAVESLSFAKKKIMLNIVLFGPPGAGKGTQSVHLVQSYGLVHLSTGDIFRSNIKGNTELGQMAKSYMDQGQLVPDDVTIKMLESEVDKHPDAKGFIFDGFPRTSAQAEALDAFLDARKTPVTCMLALEVEEEELKKRLLARAETSGRPDDADPAVIQKRIGVYKAETAPVAGHYALQGKFTGVDGIGTVEEILERLKAAIAQ